MIEFRNIETLYWVAALGSFRKAAEKLHTTQPAVSQRIFQLEQDLGVPLLRRGKRNVTPTPKGRIVLAYVEKLLALRSEMVSSVGTREALAGALRIGVAETIVHTWLPAFLERVNRVYPKLALEIEVDISPNLRERLLAQEIDLAFLLEDFTGPPLLRLPLCAFEVAFIANDQFDFGSEPVTVADLACHPIMTFSRRTQPYEVVRQIFQRSELPRVRLHASASLATLVRMAEEGLGIAVIPPAIVARALTEKSLHRIASSVVLPDLSFCAGWLDAPDATAAAHVAQIAAKIAASSLVSFDPPKAPAKNVTHRAGS